jgi:hypothetical protein
MQDEALRTDAGWATQSAADAGCRILIVVKLLGFAGIDGHEPAGLEAIELA